MAMTLKGKVVLVTGAARGIGLESCRQFGQAGARVVLAARDGLAAEQAADRLRQEGFDVQGLTLDVTNENDRNAAFGFIHQQYGLLDVLVNNAALWLESPNAATAPSIPASGLPADVLRRTFETNFFAPVILTQLMLPLLRKAEAARIVNVSSIRGSLAYHADPESPYFPFKTLAYDSSKAALNAFRIHLADELRSSGIKVNAIHPGWVRTEMGSPVAHLDLVEGARTTIQYARLDETGPTGGFFYLDDRLPW